MIILICLFIQPPRVCDDYRSEFRHCKSFLNRFHHYYTYGTVPACQQWKEDFNNCREWENHRSTEAKVPFHCREMPCLKAIDFTGTQLNRQVIKVKMFFLNIFMLILQEALQKSERNRVAEQRNFTPVWKLREVPPKDWHMPLNQDESQES